MSNPNTASHDRLVARGYKSNENKTLYNIIDKEDWDETRKFLSSVPTDGSEHDFMDAVYYQDFLYGTTTLMRSITGKTIKSEVVKLLLDVGGEELIALTNLDGKTALDIAKGHNVSDEVKDAIKTFDFNTKVKSNKLTHLLLESFVNGWGILGLFTRLDDEGSPPIKLIAESNPPVNVIRYIIEKGAVKMGETEEYRDEYLTIRSDWNDLLENAITSATNGGEPDKHDVLMSLVKTQYWDAVRIFMTTNKIKNDTRKKIVFHQGSDNDDKETVLHVAIEHRAPFNVVEQLTYFGGKELTSTRNGKGKTAYNIVCEIGTADEKILELLRTWSKKETLFLGKYRIPDTHAIHKSATSVVMKGEYVITKDEVAVKFITDYDHYKKELENRERVNRYGTDPSKGPLVMITDYFDGKKDKMSTKFLKDFDAKNSKIKLSHYQHAIVMPFADRDLETIYRNEMPSKLKNRDNLFDVLNGLKTLKKAGVVHCDVKAKNCVRIDNKIKMIDLDAASEAEAKGEGQIKDNAATFVGEKFSSGVVPPEMIYELRNKEEVDKHKTYFHELKDSDYERWKKVQPMENKFVVKSFLTVKGNATDGTDGKSYTNVVVKDMDKLPYNHNLVVADESIDLWSFGLMLYKFETGVNVFKIDEQKDDLDGFAEMQRLAHWNEKEKKDTLLKVQDNNAQSLLNFLLSRDPKKRGTIEKALDHPYFTLKSSTMGNVPITVGPNEFRINSNVIALPKNGRVDQIVATKVGEFLLYAARNGVSEKQTANGILVVIGLDEDFDKIGFCKDNDDNKFKEKDFSIQDWLEFKDFILTSCIQDGSIFINGMNGNIKADNYIIDLSIRHADQNGGTGHMNASAAGMAGCLAIKVSEDSCLADGKGKGDMKVFSGTKDPAYVPVQP